MTSYDGTPEGLAESLRNHRAIEEMAAFPAMIEALRVLQDRMTAANPPQDVTEHVTRTLTDLAKRLSEYAVPERDQLAGHIGQLPGRGQAMAPVVDIEEHTEFSARGHVTFGRFYLGGNGAVHGGAIPLAFDELMGRLANTERPPSRTASLHVNYRSITPIETRLSIEARFDSESGRKRFLSGRIRDGDTVCAEAEGLFVALRPGQP
ncbi:MAG TPA: PaaI family thioesterase [Streptosporangiaceae bacterium]|jgi:acyl-coenzyme A thioesterase PaaI-like protein|nr:PaaI family thioesterase [Streptosporangiaceae bacterium]